ncbi:unnamed protein product [Heligmosomoides polygyrus]|uniref:SCP domain-containing protein n=1 Tax=Heligmosomoides polygyrus TaxID=6339 RepID=A0A183G4A0_HELPZ|nr:unnamed protein product [Heligmosomoides polygyrus]
MRPVTAVSYRFRLALLLLIVIAAASDAATVRRDKRQLGCPPMLRWTPGVTRMDRIRNDVIRQKFGVAPIAGNMREARLRWYGHVLRGEEDSVRKIGLNFECPISVPLAAACDMYATCAPPAVCLSGQSRFLPFVFVCAAHVSACVWEGRSSTCGMLRVIAVNMPYQLGRFRNHVVFASRKKIDIESNRDLNEPKI